MAFDTFMYFTGAATAKSGSITVKGESTDTTYAAKHAFEIYSFSFGMSNPVTIGSHATGAGAGKVSISSFNVMKKMDAASPLLMLACAQGAHFPQVDVVMRKAGGKPLEFVKITFKGVFVESIQESGSAGGDDAPTESVSFAFTSYSLNYQAQDATGAAKGGPINASWDVSMNAPAAS